MRALLLLLALAALASCGDRQLSLPRGVGSGTQDLKAPPPPCACIELHPPGRRLG
jgi:hypothetical protein